MANHRYSLRKKTRRELEPKYVAELYLGSLQATRRSAIGQSVFSLPLVTVPEFNAYVNSAHPRSCS